MRDEIYAIIVRHLDERRLDPAQRPAGALPVEIVYFAYPRQDLAARLPADDTRRQRRERRGRRRRTRLTISRYILT